MFADPGLVSVMAAVGVLSGVIGILALLAVCLRWAQGRALEAVEL